MTFQRKAKDYDAFRLRCIDEGLAHEFEGEAARASLTLLGVYEGARVGSAREARVQCYLAMRGRGYTGEQIARFWDVSLNAVRTSLRRRFERSAREGAGERLRVVEEKLARVERELAGLVERMERQRVFGSRR